MLTAIIILSVITAVAVLWAGLLSAVVADLRERVDEEHAATREAERMLREHEARAIEQSRRTLARHEAQSAACRKGWETRKRSAQAETFERSEV